MGRRGLTVLLGSLRACAFDEDILPGHVTLARSIASLYVFLLIGIVVTRFEFFLSFLLLSVRTSSRYTILYNIHVFSQLYCTKWIEGVIECWPCRLVWIYVSVASTTYA